MPRYGPPSLWDPGQLRFRSHVPRRVPGAKLRRCRGSSSAAASRGVRTNSASSTLRSVRTGLRITAPASQPQCPPLCIAVRCSLSRRPPSSPSRCSKPDWAEQLLSVQEGTRKAEPTGGWRNGRVFAEERLLFRARRDFFRGSSSLRCSFLTDDNVQYIRCILMWENARVGVNLDTSHRERE